MPLTSCVLGVLLVATPALGQKISNPELFGKSLEIATKATEIYDAGKDRDALARVNDIGYRVAERANFDAFPFTFHVVEMVAPNAFALPGGHIFVTSGMLDLGLTDDMLAGLLGHEVAHVVYEHGTRMQRRAALLRGLSNLLAVGVMVGASQSGGNSSERAPYDPRVRYPNEGAEMVSGTIATGIVVSELLLRGYSREFEREADDEGQRLAAAAGFDPGALGELMALMERRLPQSREYGYWQTHPFFEDRVQASEVRSELLKRQPSRAVDDYRKRTQATLLTYADTQKGLSIEKKDFVKTEAVAAWPKGTASADIRLERLHRAREEVTDQPELQRDYGALIESYREELAEVEVRDPGAAVATTLEEEIAALVADVKAIYPRAAETFETGIYETEFLRTFLSNYPDAEAVPKVALALGDAESRLRLEADAVEHYLAALAAGRESAEGKRARNGLHVLTPRLDSLAALEHLARQKEDPELAQLAAERLASIAGSFAELEVGSEYLERYPNGDHTEAVSERLNALAEDLYAEVILYRGAGNGVKALERINRILTHAPTSPAANRLRDGAVIADEAAS